MSSYCFKWVLHNNSMKKDPKINLLQTEHFFLNSFLGRNKSFNCLI